jgi:hypothetical protein
MATDRIDFFEAVPANELLRERTENEAYCRAVEGKSYLVYFPDTGTVELPLNAGEERISLDRLEILATAWSETKPQMEDGVLKLTSHGKHTIFIVKIN